MKSAPRSTWTIVPVVAIIGLALLTSRAGGPEMAVSAPAAAESTEIRMYLRIEGIEGTYTDGLHKGCMEVLAYEQGVEIWGDPHVTEGGSDKDLRALSLTVTRTVDKVSPKLFEQCCRQATIPSVSLEVWREGGPMPQKVMVYTGHDCSMAAIRNMKALAADGSPTEELTFTCAGMEWTYIEYDASGKPKGEVHAQWPGRL